MKKLLIVVMVLALIAVAACTFVGCSDEGDDFKVGIICLHDESSTYDLNFIKAAKQAAAELGMKKSQVIIKVNVEESADCYETAKELAEAGCKLVFADSFGHEPYLLQAAKEYPNVQFCHATGTTAHTENQANFHNAFAAIYQGRYLAGIAAGMKLNEMIEAGKITAAQAKMGYVGAFTYAEVISGYTSFYLGAKSVCPSVTMEVQFTGSWFDPTAEKTAAETLIARGCKLISQHADSMGAPTACEAASVPNVSYNGSTVESCPNTFIVASKINWVPYFKTIFTAAKEGTEIATDFVGTLEDGSVALTDVNTNAAAAGTVEAIAAAKAKLISGETKVFDITTFTVGGNALDSYTADVNTDADYTPDTQVVANGEFQESKFRSAPYFDVAIDGITKLNAAY